MLRAADCKATGCGDGDNHGMLGPVPSPLPFPFRLWVETQTGWLDHTEQAQRARGDHLQPTTHLTSNYAEYLGTINREAAYVHTLVGHEEVISLSPGHTTLDPGGMSLANAVAYVLVS